MKSLARIAIVGAVAPAAVTSMSTAAVAEDEYVLSHGLGAGVEWVANGDHLYITDKIANGHSAIGFLEYDTRYYYWNRNGQGATRHVNLDLAENRPSLSVRWRAIGKAQPLAASLATLST